MPGGSAFECSAPGCHASLYTRVRAPVLTSMDVGLLTEKEAHARRHQAALRQHPSAEPQTSSQTLHTLKRYIEDALSGVVDKRIPERNMRFMLTLGGDESELLTRVGFKYLPQLDPPGGGYWLFPDLSQEDGADMFQSTSATLHSVYDELSILMTERSSIERKLVAASDYNPTPSARDLDRILGILDCKHLSGRPIIILTCRITRGADVAVWSRDLAVVCKRGCG